jgi:aminopeptidase N
MVSTGLVDRDARSSIIGVEWYDVTLDLTGGGDTFRSRTELRFRCLREGAGVLADLDAAGVERISLNGKELAPGDVLRDGHVHLPALAAQNTLRVEAVSNYSAGGTGLQRVRAGAGRRECVYGKGNQGGAPLMFCCFDQPDLRAPITLNVQVPAGWCCRANSPALRRPPDGEAGLWRFAATPAFAPYLVAFCAGPDNVLATARDGSVALSVWAPTSAGEPAPPEATGRADRMLDLVRRSIHHHGHALGLPFPYPKCDLVFVPDLVPLAYTPPGLGLLQERLLDPSVDDSALYLACVVAHETAHSWIGGVLDLRLSEEMWVQEALATYLGRAALELIEPRSSPWDVSESLPDHAYAQDAALVRQLETAIGRRAVMGGLAALLQRHQGGTVTIDDLTREWSAAAGRPVAGWAVRP